MIESHNKIINADYKLTILHLYLTIEEELDNIMSDIIWNSLNDDDMHVNEINKFIILNSIFNDTTEFLLNISKEFREVKNKNYEPNSIYAEF